MEVANYYRHQVIRDRILEFLGGSSLEDATAVFLTGSDGSSDASSVDFVPVIQLDELLERGYEIERSLQDRERLIVDLDIDYENFDSAAEAYLNPERIFRILEPVLCGTLEVLASTGILPLRLISGRGYHLVWAVDRETRAFRHLATLGEMSMNSATASKGPHTQFAPDSDLERAFTGLGLLLEYVTHRVLDMTQPGPDVPVLPTAIEVGPGRHGHREIVSLDISEYGDPLPMRHIRVPFSPYLKPRRLTWCLGEDGVAKLMPIFEVPFIGMSIESALDIMRNATAALDLASRVRTRIPDQSAATSRLIGAYCRSELAAFHRDFYRGLAKQVDEGENKDVEELPECVRWVLDHPNDWLLKPAAMQHVTRVLSALGWRPYEICELIGSRYKADFDWGDFWARHDPEQRARFYVRLFAGLIHTGRDSLIDLNCVSHREKGYCTNPWCSSNLVIYQQALPERTR
jgi:hypothetical protein